MKKIYEIKYFFLKIFYNKKILSSIIKKFSFLAIFFTLTNIFNYKNANAFGGSNSMGYGAMSPSNASSASQFKSGISIVDPDGKAYNCQPFVDKKWDNTSFEDSWNGVYFSIAHESAKYSGNMLIEESKSNDDYAKPSYAVVNDKYFNNKLSSSSSLPILTLGGGMLIDRLYLASDVDIRFGSFEIEKKIKMDDYTYAGSSTIIPKQVDAKLKYSMKTLLMFNAKIGYLATNRLLLFLNSGVGSLSSAKASIEGENYKEFSDNFGDSSPSIKVGVGLEYLLSNHFRFVLEASKWRVPKDFGEFSIVKKDSGSFASSPNNPTPSYTNYNTNLNIQTIKVGLLYRF